MRADLHIHTRFSDGTYTPEEALFACKKAGMEIVSITDHDTIKQSEQNKEIAEKLGLLYINGIEFSAYTDEQVHILGYNLEESERLKEKIGELKDMRDRRNLMIIDKVRRAGMDISLSDIVLTGGDSFGSTHIARALVKKGYAKDNADAFNRYVGFGAPCFVSELRLSAEDAIDTVLKAGGIPVLAHPGKMKRKSFSEREKYIEYLKDLGLKGIEGYYTSHTREETEYFVKLASRLGLICTSGSDCHGEGRKEKIGYPGHEISDFCLKVLLKE